MESLRRFADFVEKNTCRRPGLSPDGSTHAVWWADDHDGILAMDFLPSGEIRYAAIPQDSGWSVSGVLLPDRMMEEMEPFKRVLSDERRCHSLHGSCVEVLHAGRRSRWPDNAGSIQVSR